MDEDTTLDDLTGRKRLVAAVILAKSAADGSSSAELLQLAARAIAAPGIAGAAIAFLEQGTPSLRETLLRLRGDGFAEIVVVPMLVPMESSFPNALARSLARWREAAGGEWPSVRLAPAPAAVLGIDSLLHEMLAAALATEPLALKPKPTQEGSVVPAQKRRVLVCMGSPCNSAGAATVWGYFRNEQARRDLRNVGGGVMSAQTSCLGPCNLAPVLQVFPEGTYYGGVDETGVDRIIEEHLLGDRAVADLAYPGDGKKHRLRRTRPGDHTREGDGQENLAEISESR